ncbi:hypothetical protein M3J09_005092 [Ascochyta lentis]
MIVLSTLIPSVRWSAEAAVSAVGRAIIRVVILDVAYKFLTSSGLYCAYRLATLEADSCGTFLTKMSCVSWNLWGAILCGNIAMCLVNVELSWWWWR